MREVSETSDDSVFSGGQACVGCSSGNSSRGNGRSLSWLQESAHFRVEQWDIETGAKLSPVRNLSNMFVR